MANLIRQKLASFTDIAIMFILGISLVLYSIFYKSFAETHLTLSSLDFPVFIGEIILSLCLTLMISKWILIKKNFGKIYLWLIVYVAFFLIKALVGYIKFGPLALRHAAMFYYPLFGIIAYETYQDKFLKPGILIPLFFILALTGIGTYYNFTYLILALIFIIAVRSKWLKTMGVIALLVFFPFKLLLQCSRTQLLSHIAGFAILGLSMFLISKIKNKYKIIILAVVLLCGALVLKNNNGVKSLLNWNGFISSMENWDELIAIRKQNYKLIAVRKQHYGEQKVQLYRPEAKEDLPRLRIVPKKQTPGINEPIEDLPRLRIVPKKQTPGINEPISEGSSAYLATITSNNSPQQKVVAKSKQNNNKIVNSAEKELINKEDAPMDMAQRHNTALFRFFAWRDIIRELIKEKRVLGFDFGKPFRSESLELTEMATTALREDGWISAHNSYLEIIYRSGFIGIILFTIFFLTLFKLIKQFLFAKSYYGILLVSIIFYWITTAIFYVTLEMPYSAIFFWTIFGITLAYCQKTLKCKI